MKIEILKTNQTLELIPFNRSINPNEYLRESLRKHGFKDTIKVITTSIFGRKNEQYIVDGQHRYNEGKILKMSIPYINVGTYDNICDIVELIATYNNTQRKWTSDNYVDCYCAVGLSDYIFLRTKKGETSFSYDVLTTIYCGSKDNKKKLMTGKLSILDRNKGNKILEYVLDMLKVSEFPYRAIRGFIYFHNILESYNHDKFIRSLKANIKLTEGCQEQSQYAGVFYTIYTK